MLLLLISPKASLFLAENKHPLGTSKSRPPCSILLFWILIATFCAWANTKGFYLHLSHTPNNNTTFGLQIYFLKGWHILSHTPNNTLGIQKHHHPPYILRSHVESMIKTHFPHNGKTNYLLSKNKYSYV
jgi:hypothetical protein